MAESTKGSETKEVKEETKPKAPRKPALKKPVAKKTVKAEEAAPEAAKAPEKAAEKKPAVRKAKKAPEATANVMIQFDGKEYVAKDILEKAKAAFAEENKEVELQTINLYIKPEEGAAYYVGNGDISGKVEL